MVISSNESLSHQSPPQVRGAQKICVQQEVPAFEGNLSLLWSNVSFVILRYVRFVIFPQDLWSSASSQSPRERCFSVSNTLFPASFQAQLFRHTERNKTLPKAQRTRGLSSSCQSNFLRSCYKFNHKS